jgi:lipid A 4'-phosphatase
MGRAGLLIVLSIAVAAGLVLGLVPDIDLSIASFFFRLGQAGSTMPEIWIEPTVSILRKIGFWIEIVLIALPVIALATKLILPRRKMLIPGSAIVFLAASLVLGPGLLVNVGLKNHWGRPRPGRIEQFGGDQKFVPWWQPNGGCRKNCSFVSGEAAAAFWTLAPAALAPPEWQPVAYGMALVFGATISLSRMVTGGHFLSDTIFAGVFTFLIVWLTYAVVYRWRRTRLTDDMIEDALEHFAISLHGALRRLVRPFGARADNQMADADEHAGKPRLKRYAQGVQSALFDGVASRDAT